MPLRQTIYGLECPLDVWTIDVAAGGGCYTSDPLVGCLGDPELGVVSCNFFKFPKNGEKFDPAVQCQCPADMTKEKYRELKKEYAGLIDKGEVIGTKKDFWRFVREKRRG